MLLQCHSRVLRWSKLGLSTLGRQDSAFTVQHITCRRSSTPDLVHHRHVLGNLLLLLLGRHLLGRRRGGLLLLLGGRQHGVGRHHLVLLLMLGLGLGLRRLGLHRLHLLLLDGLDLVLNRGGH